MASPFSTILNFRDVAESVNESSGRKLLRTGMLYRSATLDNCSKDDGDRLRTELCIQTVLQLNPEEKTFVVSKGALRYVPEGHDGKSSRNFMGVNYVKVMLASDDWDQAQMRRLSWYSKLRFFGWELLEDRRKAYGLVTRKVLAPRGLVGLVKDNLDYSGPRIKGVFETLADPKAYPILIHSKHGKEDVGLIVLLVSMLSGVPLEAAQADYMRSEIGLSGVRDERIANNKELEFPADWLGCPPTWVRDLVEHITQNYGSVERYLEQIGVPESTQEVIISLLADESTEKLLDL